MKKRIAYLIAFFAMVLGCFLIQKPLFMLYNDAVEKGVSPADFGRVILHGFTLDATTAGYLTVIPWLVVLISIWFRQFPLRKILTGYYVLISFLVMLIFIVDMALYPFWGFKLDASIFRIWIHRKMHWQAFLRDSLSYASLSCCFYQL